MNYILTGARHIGKSTVLNNTVRALGLRIGGFRTVLWTDGESRDRVLFMYRADGQLEIDTAHRVAVFSGGQWQALPDRFDTLGRQFLWEAAGTADLIVMDELGWLEKDAEEFRQAVFRALDLPVPVLGVVREGFPGWTDGIAGRGDVCVITVTEDTRDALPRKLADLIKLTQKEIGAGNQDEKSSLT